MRGTTEFSPHAKRHHLIRPMRDGCWPWLSLLRASRLEDVVLLGGTCVALPEFWYPTLNAVDRASRRGRCWDNWSVGWQHTKEQPVNACFFGNHRKIWAFCQHAAYFLSRPSIFSHDPDQDNRKKPYIRTYKAHGTSFALSLFLNTTCIESNHPHSDRFHMMKSVGYQ